MPVASTPERGVRTITLEEAIAAALATLLLIVVLTLYYAYDRIVGIDNVKLG